MMPNFAKRNITVLKSTDKILQLENKLAEIQKSFEQLQIAFDVLVKENKTLITENRELKAKNTKLEEKIAKLSKTSKNSSKPPSSDIVKNKRNKSKGERKIGGQTGHPKHERKAFTSDEIHSLHEYNLTKCPCCGDLLEIDLNKAPKILQQVEIVAAPLHIEEHKSYAYWCNNCQKYHFAKFPDSVQKEGLFKAKISALVAFMKHVLHASYSNIRKYFRDVLQLNISRGYLRKVIEKVSNSLESPYEELLQRIPLSSTVNVDETGHKENGDKFWTWVFRTDLFILFKINKSRGSKVLLEVLGKDFDGILGSDYFSAYRKFMKDFNITIQFCIAHLIRDLKFLTSLPDKKSQEYGDKLLAWVKNMFAVIHKKTELSEESFKLQLHKSKAEILRIALQEAPIYLDKKGKLIESRRAVRNMVVRFKKHGKSYFEFITNPAIDPTNNIAEQAIRFIVIDRLVTQGTRSEKGRISNERIWTVIATCSLQSNRAYDFLTKAIESYFNSTPSPSLIFDSD
jgi:transposase